MLTLFLKVSCRAPVVFGCGGTVESTPFQPVENQTDCLPDTEIRHYRSAELALLVTTFRQAHGWFQETLAELSGVTPRTVQRVEAGEPSSLDTRRALARAFALDDIDTFDRPHEMATPEGAARAREDFDSRFTVVEIEPVDGRTLVTGMVARARLTAPSTPAR